MFLTFEGIDGCGKTTQWQLLAQYFERKNIDYLAIREPGATLIGEKLREIIHDPLTQINSYTEAYLYAACRAELVTAVIKPALLTGQLVICDRFLDSSLAYQGFARGLGVDKVRHINQVATEGVTPDLTFWIDTPIDKAQERLKKTALDRIEQEGVLFKESVRSGYIALAKANTRIITIDGSQSIEAIHQQILFHIKNKSQQPPSWQGG